MMFDPIIHLLTIIFYQPFLNALVLIYDGLVQFFNVADMGIAVIIFSLGIRLVLLPLSLASTQSEDERRKLGREYSEIERIYKSSEPLKYQKLRGDLVKKNRHTLRFEMINLGIQIVIALVLWRVFGEGLKGEDLHLLYSWVPKENLNFNLTFLNMIDLTKPSLVMNLLSASLMFVVETLHITFSPLPPDRQDRIVQFLLPPIVFIYLYTMPAGKKFFIVTTLAFSIVYVMVRELIHISHLLGARAKK